MLTTSAHLSPAFSNHKLGEGIEGFPPPLYDFPQLELSGLGQAEVKKKKKKCVKDKEGRCDKRYNLWNSAKGQRWSRGKTVSPLNDFCCNTCEIRNAEKIKKGYRKMCKKFLVLCSIYVVVKNVAEKKKKYANRNVRLI